MGILFFATLWFYWSVWSLIKGFLLSRTISLPCTCELKYNYFPSSPSSSPCPLPSFHSSFIPPTPHSLFPYPGSPWSRGSTRRKRVTRRRISRTKGKNVRSWITNFLKMCPRQLLKVKYFPIFTLLNGGICKFPLNLKL